MVQKITPVILSGGSGTRLWPVSTADLPKQFLQLAGELTLFQQALTRVQDNTVFGPPVIVANEAHVKLVETQLKKLEINSYSIIIEPAGRNTAPAIALAALAVSAQDTPLLIMPSDHVISDLSAFREAVGAALPYAADGRLVTFGIEPDAPETGYGYVKLGKQLSGNVSEVASFVEKPDAVTAQNMLAEGCYRWNAGIFLFRADAYLSALSSYSPDIFESCKAALDLAERNSKRISPARDHFLNSPSDSIDYAVMEKADNVATVSVSMGWSDLGNWEALYQIGSKDNNGNVIVGDVRVTNCSNCYIRSNGHAITLMGMNDMIIIAEDSNVVALPRANAQSIKNLSERK